MIAVDARALSMRLTLNHRTLVFKARRIRRGPEVVMASDLRPKYDIPRSLPGWCDDGQEKGIGVDFATLCAWVAAEGHIRSDRRIGLCQSSVVNPQHVITIDQLLGRCTSEAVTRRVETDGMVRWGLPRELSTALLSVMPGKVLPDWFCNLPLPEAEAALGAFVDGDGHTRVGGRVGVTQKYRANLDVLQALAVRLGWKTSLYHYPSKTGAQWDLRFTRGPDAALRRSDGTSLIRLEDHAGLVWCPTTGTGTFVARRNGHVFITGNSYGPEHGRGLLFGKYSGRFWIGQYARGSAELGESRHDYRLRTEMTEAR